MWKYIVTIAIKTDQCVLKKLKIGTIIVKDGKKCNRLRFIIYSRKIVSKIIHKPGRGCQSIEYVKRCVTIFSDSWYSTVYC